MKNRKLIRIIAYIIFAIGSISAYGAALLMLFRNMTHVATPVFIAYNAVLAVAALFIISVADKRRK